LTIPWGLIVEGHGETDALPLLLRRLIPNDAFSNFVLHPPIRRPRSSLILPGDIENLVSILRRRIGRPGVILILLDTNGSLPCEDGPALFNRCKQAVSDIPISVVLANQEFECWFLGALESLRNIRGIREDVISFVNPESIRDAKGRLSNLMTGMRTYKPTVDQAALTAKFDIEVSRSRCPSLDKLIRDVNHLIQTEGEI